MLRHRLATYLSTIINNRKLLFTTTAGSQETGNSKQGTVRTVKLPRKGLASMLQKSQPIYETTSDFLTESEKSYKEKVQKKINENSATKNFYTQEFERGEDLIDNIPLDPYYEYKNADLEMELKTRERMMNNLKGISNFVDPHRYQRLKHLAFRFQNKKHRYELEEFLKKLKEYPGSIRGPNPEDDPQVYFRYANSIMPESVRAIMKVEMEGKDSNMNLSGENVEHKIIAQYRYVTDFLSSDAPAFIPPPPHIEDAKDKEEEQKMVEEWEKSKQALKFLIENTMYDIDSQREVVPYSDVPLFPYTNFDEYHSFMQKMKTWCEFRRIYDKQNKSKKLEQIKKIFSQIEEGRAKRYQLSRKNNVDSEVPNEGPMKVEVVRKTRKGKKTVKYQKVELKPAIYSLYNYYKSLPKEIQEHPGVQITYLGLQYSSPDTPYHKKEEILNLAAKSSLPMDKFSDDIMEKGMMRRPYLDPHLTDRIYNISPEFTWDIHEFLNEVKDEKLRTISTVKEENKSYPEPPDPTRFTSEGLAKVPVDFYDNADGFWSDYMDQKLKNYQKVQPLCKKEKNHFFH